MALTLDRFGFAYPVPAASPSRRCARSRFAWSRANSCSCLVRRALGSRRCFRLLLGCSAPHPAGERLTARSSAHCSEGRRRHRLQDPESQLFADTVLDDVAFGPVNFGAARDDAMRDARTAIGRVGSTAEEFAPRWPSRSLVGRVGG